MPAKPFKLVAFGDIIGKPGREAFQAIIPEIRKKYSPDMILANGENLAHNDGINEKILKEILEYGVDFITLGDHAFDREKEMIKIFSSDSYPIVRPANFPPGVPGIGYKVINIAKKRIAVINMLGRVFLRQSTDCPFRTADNVLQELKNKADIIIFDFHAEATSEKKAMGYYLDGRVSLVYGTHTHIPTADEQILPKNTAYITDIGMVGPHNSIIGAQNELSIKHFLTQMPFNYEISDDNTIEANGIYAEIDSDTGKAIRIERVRKFFKA